MHLTHFGLAIISLTFGVSAAFADPSPAPSPSPTPAPVIEMTRVKGEPVRWIFSDGREATLYSTSQPAMEASASIGFSDTSCGVPDPLPKCTLHFSVKDIPLVVKWTKTPDASRLNQIVKVFNGNLFTEDAIFSPYSQLTDKVNAADLKPTRLECDDFTWLTGTKDSPPQFTLANWSGELMETNPETGIPENKTDVGVYEPVFQRIDDRTMELTSAGQWFSTSFLGVQFWFFRSDIIHFVTQATPGHPSCQYAFKPAFGKARRDIEDAYRKLNLPSVPYIDGQDGYLDVQLKSPFTFFTTRMTEDDLK